MAVILNQNEARGIFSAPIKLFMFQVTKKRVEIDALFCWQFGAVLRFTDGNGRHLIPLFDGVNHRHAAGYFAKHRMTAVQMRLW